MLVLTPPIDLVRQPTPQSGTSWGPRGQLAYIEDVNGKRPRLMVLDTPAARARALVTVPAEAIAVLWSPAGDLVVQLGAREVGGPTRAYVLDERGVRRANVPEPWVVLGFAPDGMLRATRRDTGQVSALHAPGYNEPLDIGRLPASVPLWGVAF